MSYRLDWCGVLVEAALVPVHHEFMQWLLAQPKGWARDGAYERRDKVMSTLINKHLRVALLSARYLPPEMRQPNITAKAVRAFERFVGRRPDEAYVETVEFEDDIIFKDTTVMRVRVEFLCVEQYVDRPEERHTNELWEVEEVPIDYFKEERFSVWATLETVRGELERTLSG